MAWPKGRKFSDEHRAKIGAKSARPERVAELAARAAAYVKTPEARAKMSERRTGVRFSDERKAKIGAATRRYMNRPEIQAIRRGAMYRLENNPMWIGDTAGYRTRHRRVERNRGLANNYNCIDCGVVAVEWSQIHGTDGLDVEAHYVPRCRSCHRRYDHNSNR